MREREPERPRLTRPERAAPAEQPAGPDRLAGLAGELVTRLRQAAQQPAEDRPDPEQLAQRLREPLQTFGAAFERAEADQRREQTAARQQLVDERQALLQARHAPPNTTPEVPQDEGEYVVTGRVLDPETGVGLPGLRVVAIDRDVSRHDLLGQAITDEAGRYRISYTAEAFAERGENLAEIEVGVVGADGEPLNPERNVRLESGRSERIDIELPAGDLPEVLERGRKQQALLARQERQAALRRKALDVQTRVVAERRFDGLAPPTRP